MNEYEVYIEEINPCGGEKHAIKKIIEVEADSPEAYVKEYGRFPILDITTDDKGDTTILTGDGNGYLIRYVFTE